MHRIRQPAMQELMANTQEIEWDELSAFTSANSAFAGGVVDLVADESPAVAGDSGAKLHMQLTEREFKALEWSTNIKDRGVLMALCDMMPDAVVEEQVRAYESRPEPQPPCQPKQMIVYPHNLKSRLQVVKAFDEHLRGRGWDGKGRLPYKARAEFEQSLTWSSGGRLKARQKQKALGQWHARWLKGKSLDVLARAPDVARQVGTIKNAMRRRAPFRKEKKCEWLRQELYEWWAGTRFSVDWDAIRRGVDHTKVHKRIARYTASMLKAQAEHFVAMYCAEQLKRGAKPKVPRLRSDWFADWRREYGLSMRLPNRKYKAPKWLVGQRLEVGWLNMARVRQACHEILGYDPEVWNFDQSPFYHNESGSKNLPTLHVRGAKVPLIELHAETRARWTVNLLTRSDGRALLQDGPPHVEFVFKADGKELEAKLQAHVRGRGWKNAPVQTSPKGSYRTPDVLRYLDACLPRMPAPGDARSEAFRWRILLADDHGPHHDEEVAKLAWNRGFIMMLHGGGVTPIVQTVDTDLNGPVKQKYVERESRSLLSMMSAGVSVPRLRPEELMDMMMGTLDDMNLHLAGAEGYIRTGMRVGLGKDDSLDGEVTREAGDFWRERGMRAKINEVADEVSEACRNGHIRWCYNDVRGLIQSHPRHKRTDEVRAAMGDDKEQDGVDDAPFKDEEGDSDAEKNSDDDLWDEADGYGSDGGGGGGGGDGGGGGGGGKGGEGGGGGSQDGADGAAIAAVAAAGQLDEMPTLQAHDSEELRKQQHTLEQLTEMKATVEQLGHVSLAQCVSAEIHRVERQMRAASRETPGVLDALRLERRREVAREQERLRHVQEANLATKSLHSVKLQLKDAEKSLKQKRAAVAAAENTMLVKHSVKQFSMAELGSGSKNGNGAKGKKARHDVLNRMSQLGAGLSKAQAADFPWFKEEWDKKMLSHYEDRWGETFAGWMQKVVQEHEDAAVAAFSKFVHQETQRCFAGREAVLRITAS